MFGTTNIAKNSDKSQWVCSGLEIAFDAKGEWNFGNESAGNVVIFSVDNSSWSNADNWKNDFLVLDEGDTFGINGNICTQERKFSINFSKARTTFCLSLHFNGDNSYWCVNGKKSISLKQMIKMSTFQIIFV